MPGTWHPGGIDAHPHGNQITSTIGPGENLHRTFVISLGDLASGAHTVTLQYAGGGANGGNQIDALSLRGSTPISVKPLWQIGKYDGALQPSGGAKEFGQGPFTSVYSYDLDNNPDDQIQAPDFPGSLDDQSRPWCSAWTAGEVNVSSNSGARSVYLPIVLRDQ